MLESTISLGLPVHLYDDIERRVGEEWRKILPEPCTNIFIIIIITTTITIIIVPSVWKVLYKKHSIGQVTVPRSLQYDTWYREKNCPNFKKKLSYPSYVGSRI